MFSLIQVWPINEKKYENMSFLPPLSNQEIAKQVQYLVNNGWVPCVEFANQEDGFAIGGNSANVMSPGYYDNRYWTMYKLPMYGCTDPGQVLEEIYNCKMENPGCFVRLLGFDNVRQVQCAGLIIVRPDQGAAPMGGGYSAPPQQMAPPPPPPPAAPTYNYSW